MSFHFSLWGNAPFGFLLSIDRMTNGGKRLNIYGTLFWITAGINLYGTLKC